MVFLDIKCQGQKVSYQQKEYSCEIWKLWHSLLKFYTQG